MGETKPQRKIKKIEYSKELFNERCTTKIVEMGNVVELTTMQKKPSAPPTRKIDKDTYFNTYTGEVGLYKHIEDRSQSTQGIKHTLDNIKALINTNCSEPQRVKWVTLTYAENMTDTEQLCKDFEKFWKKFLYYCKKKGYTKPEYINVIEPQGRGAWHSHSFFIWSDKAPFIPNADIETLWGKGFTKTKACDDCDNVGVYFGAYLGDMPLEEYVETCDISKSVTVQSKEFTDIDGNTKEKKFVKGGRLHLYPAGMNIIRHSRGIKKPVISYDTRLNAEKKVCSAKQTFTTAFEIAVDDVAINVICKEYYNTKRK